MCNCVTVCTESNVTGVKCAAIDLICNLRCEFTTLIEKPPSDKLTMWCTVGVAQLHGTSSGACRWKVGGSMCLCVCVCAMTAVRKSVGR